MGIVDKVEGVSTPSVAVAVLDIMDSGGPLLRVEVPRVAVGTFGVLVGSVDKADEETVSRSELVATRDDVTKIPGRETLPAPPSFSSVMFTVRELEFSAIWISMI